MTGPGVPVIHRFTPTDPRLGRHVLHDPTSRDYDMRALLLAEAPPTTTVLWDRVGPIFDQGRCPPDVLAELDADPAVLTVGCCTAAAAFGLLITEPLARAGLTYTIDDVLRGYHVETTLDDTVTPGQWPPIDTGSTGLYAMKMLRQRGLIQAYRWAFRLTTTLAYLGHGPVAIGSVWFDSMFTVVDRDGRSTVEISPNAVAAGGHEYILDGIDPAARLVRMTNSWGLEWGDDGHAWLTYATLDRLLSEQGDVVTPVVRPQLPGRLRGSHARASSVPGTPGVGRPD